MTTANRWRVVWKRERWFHKKAKSFGSNLKRAEEFAGFIENDPSRAYPGVHPDDAYCARRDPKCSGPDSYEPYCGCEGTYREHCQKAADAMVDSGSLQFCRVEGRHVSRWRIETP